MLIINFWLRLAHKFNIIFRIIIFIRHLFVMFRFNISILAFFHFIYHIQESLIKLLMLYAIYISTMVQTRSVVIKITKTNIRSNIWIIFTNNPFCFIWCRVPISISEFHTKNCFWSVRFIIYTIAPIWIWILVYNY